MPSNDPTAAGTDEGEPSSRSARERDPDGAARRWAPAARAGDHPARSTPDTEPTRPPAERSAVVLAGGRSRRFADGDKALAPISGTPMLRRVVDRLGGVVGTVVVNCRADQRPAFEAVLSGARPRVRFAVDPVEDAGPLAGLRTGVAAVTDRRAMVVACDMPLVHPGVVDRLFRAGATDEVAVVHDGGQPQPAHAVYPVRETLAACERALAEGDRALRSILGRLPTRRPSALDGDAVARSVTNVNSPVHLREAESELG